MQVLHIRDSHFLSARDPERVPATRVVSLSSSATKLVLESEQQSHVDLAQC